MKNLRGLAILCAGVLPASTALRAATTPGDDASRFPNILLVYTDDQGYGDASCLNPDAKFRTPNHDRLAREGMTFTDGHCSDTVCTPSRYGLLTGRYSWRTTLKRGVFGAEKPCLIADGRVTLPSLLRDHGYATAMVGKWHLGMDFPGTQGDRDWSQPVRDMPLDKGFDYFWGIPASMNYGVLAWFEGRHAAVPPTLWTKKKPNQIALADYRIMPPYERERKPGLMEVAPDFIDSECLTRFTDQAIKWIEGKAEGARNGKPFFLYLPYTSPHKPVIPVEKFRGRGKAGAYGEFMIETDWHLGRLLDLLDREKLAANTIVIYTADNGPETTWKERIKRFDHFSSGPYREGKRSVYEGGHRVPFFIRWPAVIKAGSTWDQPVCQTDILATVAEILGKALPAKAGEDSVSFLTALRGGTPATARPPVIHHGANGRFAIRHGKWKLVMESKRKGEKRELYDLAADRGEQNDVLAGHPAVEKRLFAQLVRIVTSGETRAGADSANDTPPWDELVWLKP
ncbi:MAG: arylsulfatase [Akkermansiaceae bacterium]|nr:arylsulfatase [Akkermansiaceae bacterium]NNM29034.1 arylsulfatase [Akkermansiaceae bacterium]